jgi:hypothetical protein
VCFDLSPVGSGKGEGGALHAEMLQQTQDCGQAFQEPLAQAALAAMGEKKQDRKLPKGLGEKRLRLEGTPEETEKLHHYLSGQMAAQSAPRATSR